MRHIILLNPLEKLNLKKDSTLFLAAKMKLAGVKVQLWFEDDFFYLNHQAMTIQVHDFDFNFKPDQFYLDSFSISTKTTVALSAGDVLHMRIDPPFDSKYLRYLWMLRGVQAAGVRVVNAPDGILRFNEKLHAYSQKSSLASYIGSSVNEFTNFCRRLPSTEQFLILKPLDLFQGEGVTKVSIQDPNLVDIFQQKIKESGGPIVAQVFLASVEKGEIRSTYFNGSELGSILKVPPTGEFLANIARGAKFHSVTLEPDVKAECNRIASELVKEGILWIAFDVLSGHMSEVNITCPGLLVETSYAHKKNLAEAIIKHFK